MISRKWSTWIGVGLIGLSFWTLPGQAQEVLDEEFEQQNELNVLPSIDSFDTNSTFESEPGLPQQSRDLDPNGAPIAPIPDLPNDHYRRPQGPAKGGKFKIEHPGAAKGLLKIDKSGYQYKVPVKEKSRAASFRFGFMSAPKVTSPRGTTFTDMYPASLVGVLGEYEWMPFRSFGALGVQFGTGLVIARGNGRFGDNQLAEEVYNLFVIPISGLVVYRFEFMNKQWFVPFVNGGATYFGLAEKRDDAKAPTFAGSPAAVAGGGVHFNISRWDMRSAFTLSKEYGVADLWLTLEYRATIGLKQDLDFTNNTASMGFTVDF